MTIQLSVAARDDRLQAFVTSIGASPVLKFFTGTQPADCATANSGTAVVSVTLSASFAGTPSAGTCDFTDFPQSVTCIASGTAAHFRLYQNDGTTCMMQGEVTLVGGGGNMTVNVVNMLSGNNYNVSSFTIGDNNA